MHSKILAGLTISGLCAAALLPSPAGAVRTLSPVDDKDKAPLILRVNSGYPAEIFQKAQDFVEDVAHRGIEILSDTTLTEEDRKKAFHALLLDNFDMNTIARFSLGRYWRIATKEERDQYMKLFREMIVDVYSARLSEYKGQDVDVRSARAAGKTDVLVTSYIVSEGSGPEIQVDWRLRRKDEHYRIIDVIVEGVSMSVTQRSDFAAVIQRGGGSVQALLASLQKH